MSTAQTSEHHHVFTYDGTYVAVWGQPMTEAGAKAEADRLSGQSGFVTIWVARYDEDPCRHGGSVPNGDFLEVLRTRPPYWQRPDTTVSTSVSPGKP